MPKVINPISQDGDSLLSAQLASSSNFFSLMN